MYSLILSAFVIFSFSTLAFAQTIDQENELLNAGVELTKLEKYDDAILIFNKVLEINPNNTYAINNIAYSHYQQGYYIQAVKEYVAILKIDPSDETAKNNLQGARKHIPYLKIKGFLEITIHNSQNHLISYIKSDKVEIMDGKDTDDYLKRLFHKKIITHNGEKLETYQFDQTVRYTADHYAGITGLAIAEFPRIFAIYANTNQYYVAQGDTVTFHYTFFVHI